MRNSCRALTRAADHLCLKLLEQAAIHHLSLNLALNFQVKEKRLRIDSAIGELQNGAQVHASGST